MGQLPPRLHSLHNQVTDLEVLLHEIVGRITPGNANDENDEEDNDGWYENSTDSIASAVDNATNYLTELRTTVTDIQQSGITSSNARHRAFRRELPRLNQLHKALVQCKEELNRILGAGRT